MNQNRPNRPESSVYINGVSSNRVTKPINHEERSKYPHKTTALPSVFQPDRLKREPPLGYDKNSVTQRTPDSTTNTRGSIKAPNHQQSKRISNLDQTKRL